MRIFLTSAALAASLALAPAAIAAGLAQTSTGAVKSYDAKAHTLTLTDGTTYILPAKVKTHGLKAGEKVQISWQKMGNMNDATAVKILK